MKHTRAQEVENKEPFGDSNAIANQNKKELLKERRNKIKSNRLKEKYIKRSMTFLEVYEKLEYNLRTEILSHQMDEVESIIFIFGTSLVSPKEIYRLQLPAGNIFKGLVLFIPRNS